MYTVNYTKKRTFEKYDAEHYLLYLNEQNVTFVPPAARMPGDEAGDAEAAEVSGYSYTGDRPDGGTLIKAKNADYGEFVAGLIQVKYSSDAEAAIHANYLLALGDAAHPKAEQYRQEFDAYNATRNECKANAKAVLGL
jgi:hypothetical protein